MAIRLNGLAAVCSYLALQIDKVANYNSMVCVWHLSGEKIGHTFTRFALPITWDFTEPALTDDVGGAYGAQLDWVCRYIDHGLCAKEGSRRPALECQSAIELSPGEYDAVITDPPYYDAIPYSDLMDFFYLWLKRSLSGLSPELDVAFKDRLSPKWDHEKNDGDSSTMQAVTMADPAKSKAIYETGMARAFQKCGSALKPDGRMVVVFANKQPDAWEALVSALVRSGFVVDGSWPIQTEMNTRCAQRRPPPSPPPSGSSARSAPQPPARDGITRFCRRCGRTSPSASASSGTRGFEAPTSCRRRPARRWKPTASTPWSRRPTIPERRWR
jgi:adenine-specific DNA methylase